MVNSFTISPKMGNYLRDRSKYISRSADERQRINSILNDGYYKDTDRDFLNSLSGTILTFDIGSGVDSHGIIMGTDALSDSTGVISNIPTSEIDELRSQIKSLKLRIEQLENMNLKTVFYRPSAHVHTINPPETTFTGDYI